MSNHNSRLERLEKVMVPPSGEFCSCPFAGNYRALVNVDTPEVCPRCGKPPAVRVVWKPPDLAPLAETIVRLWEGEPQPEPRNEREKQTNRAISTLAQALGSELLGKVTE